MNLLSFIFFLIVGLAVFASLREWFLSRGSRESLPPGFSGSADPVSYDGIGNVEFSGHESQHHGTGDHCSSHDAGCDAGGHGSFDSGHGGFDGGFDGGGHH
jgi:hypothetical protein